MKTKLFVKLVCAVSVVALYGCSSLTPKASIPEGLVQATEKAPESIVNVQHLGFRFYGAYESMGSSESALMVQTKTDLVFIDSQMKQGKMHVYGTIPLSQIQTVAVAKAGAFDRMQQVHLNMENGSAILSFSQDVKVEVGDPELTLQAEKVFQLAGFSVGKTEFNWDASKTLARSAVHPFVSDPRPAVVPHTVYTPREMTMR